MSAGARGTRLVIDASVARSSGETDHPVSSLCRLFLKEVLEANFEFRLVMSDEILTEWKRHRSSYSLRSHATMTAKRRVIVLDNAWDEALRLAASSSRFQAYGWCCGSIRR
jgi:hypothetical protein